MLISCFQCRQQLDVPEDSAGKRVRCPHCFYVIVVPEKPRALEAAEAASPAVALPSMELEPESSKTPVTKIAPAPLPPLQSSPGAPPPESDTLPLENKPEDEPKSSASEEDMPPVPSIEMGGSGRRKLMAPAPGWNVSWGRIIGIGAVVFVVLIGIIIAIVTSTRNRPQMQPIAKNPIVPPMPFPNPGMGMNLPRPNNPAIPNFNLPAFQWKTMQFAEQRCKTQMPSERDNFVPPWRDEHFNDRQVRAFEASQADWHFSVSHAVIPEKEFNDKPVNDRLMSMEQFILNMNFNSRLQNANPILLQGRHQGKDWEFGLQQFNQILRARVYFVRDGNRYHQYLLRVRFPAHFGNNPHPVTHFFNSFALLVDEGSFLDETDSLQQGARRDNEFLTVALHSKEPIYAVGTVGARIKIGRIDGQALNKDQAFGPNKIEIAVDGSVEQLVISADGRFLANSIPGAVQCRRDWTMQVPKNRNITDIRGGVRAAFTKQNHLLVAMPDEIKEFDLDQEKYLANLPIPDLRIQGFALSPDDKTLAIFGGKELELWSWPDKKRLGRLEGHDKDITTVAFTSDSKMLASGSTDRTIKLWNVEALNERATLKQHAWAVCSLAFTADGQHLASGGVDGMLLYWRLSDARLVWAQANQFPVRCVTFDGEGKHCFFTSKQAAPTDFNGGQQFVRRLRKVPLADMIANPPEAERIVAQRAGLLVPATNSMYFNLAPNGDTFFSTADGLDNLSTSNCLRFWDTATGRLRQAHSSNYNGVMSPDGKWVVFAQANIANTFSMQLLEVATKKVSPVIATIRPAFPAVAFAADSKSVWMLRNHELVRYEIAVLPNKAPTLVQKTAMPIKAPVNDARLMILLPSRDRKMLLVELVSADRVKKSRILMAMAPYKIGEREYAVGEKIPLDQAPADQFLRLRNFGGHVELHDYALGTSRVVGNQRNFNPLATALTSDGKYGATCWAIGGPPGRVVLWDLTARQPILTLSEIGARSIMALRFSDDGKTLAIVTGESWTRIVPVDWLHERRAYLPCAANEVSEP